LTHHAKLSHHHAEASKANPDVPLNKPFNTISPKADIGARSRGVSAAPWIFSVARQEKSVPSITTFGLLTRRSMSSWSAGAEFFNLLISAAPPLVPRRFDVSEPITRVFNPARVNDALTLWGGPHFFWTTWEQAGTGSYLEGVSRDLCDAIIISVESDSLASASLLDFLRKAALAFDAEFAYLHKTFDEEVQDRDFYKSHVMPFCQGLSAPEFEKGLPGAAWAMYFGGAWIRELDRDRLRNAPVFAAEALLNGGVLLQMTERLERFGPEYDEFRLRGRTLVEYVGPHVFARNPAQSSLDSSPPS
jgi:hypothetical protein